MYADIAANSAMIQADKPMLKKPVMPAVGQHDGYSEVRADIQELYSRSAHGRGQRGSGRGRGGAISLEPSVNKFHPLRDRSAESVRSHWSVLSESRGSLYEDKNSTDDKTIPVYT